MRAIVRDEYGPPERLRMEERDPPCPTGDEVLVRVRAVALNASDWELLTGKPLYARIWGWFTPKVRVLGSDISGVVEAVGPEVTEFRVGDPVYGDIFETWGGMAEFACARQGLLRHKPSTLSHEGAAALPQSGAIAIQGLRGVGPGQRVLVNGAGGGGGSFAIQIARHLGAEVTAVDRAEKLEFMRSLGADHVIDATETDFTRTGERYDLVLDLVGHHSVLDFRRSLAPSGRYRLVGGSVRLLLGVLIFGSLLSIVGRKRMRVLALKPNRGLDELEALCTSGAVRPVVDAVLPLEEAPLAFHRLGEGQVQGKVVLTIGQS